jgi:transposase
VKPATGQRRYRHHAPEFKRALVEESFRPGGASVARIAMRHGLNANQLFKWRRAFLDGTLDTPASSLLPVEVVPGAMTPPAPLTVARGADSRAPRGVMIVESARGRVQIEGQPSAETLRVVLEQLLR